LIGLLEIGYFGGVEWGEAGGSPELIGFREGHEAEWVADPALGRAQKEWFEEECFVFGFDCSMLLGPNVGLPGVGAQRRRGRGYGLADLVG
jgi:hypothetical protein